MISVIQNGYGNERSPKTFRRPENRIGIMENINKIEGKLLRVQGNKRGKKTVVSLQNEILELEIPEGSRTWPGIHRAEQNNDKSSWLWSQQVENHSSIWSVRKTVGQSPIPTLEYTMKINTDISKDVTAMAVRRLWKPWKENFLKWREEFWSISCSSKLRDFHYCSRMRI